jgi:hypothetical protein
MAQTRKKAEPTPKESTKSSMSRQKEGRKSCTLHGALKNVIVDFLTQSREQPKLASLTPAA